MERRVIHYDNSPKSLRDVLRPRKVSSEEWDQMTLFDKWKTSFEPDDFNKELMSRAFDIGKHMGTGLLLWSVITVQYCVVAFMADEMFAHTEPWFRLCLKAYCTFVTAQVFCNWFLVLWYRPFLQPSKDNLDGDTLIYQELPAHNGTQSVIQVEDSNSDRSGLVWKWCDKCKLKQPPRAHHCKVCNRCILKRDHHCYFTRTCIGYTNQRFFTVFVFYIIIGAASYFPFCVQYMWDNFEPRYHGKMDYFLPVALINHFRNGLEFKFVMVLSHCYLVWMGGVVSFGFFATQMLAACKGLTPREISKNSVRSTGTVGDNFRDVFGQYWLLNFVFPFVCCLKQPGNGKHWNNIKKT